jgi:hypothetical protein
MEESLCSVEFVKDNSIFIARVQSEVGGVREFRGPSLEEVLDQVVQDLRDEFETTI